MIFKKLQDAELTGKKVLVRADLDVPLKDGKVADDKRLECALPTFKHILEHGAKQLIIMGHLHRPGGQVVPEMRMDPVAERLGKLLGEPVKKLDDCIDIDIPEDRIILLENLRFHKEEKENYEFFAKKLAKHADIYVNDAFAVSHREHASLVGITEFLPSYAGLKLQNELKMFAKVTNDIEHPYVAVIGGAKISTKIKVIDNLLKKVDKLLLGGAMIFTFYKAMGYEVGKSLYEEEHVKLAKLLMHNEKLLLPKDVVVAKDKAGHGRPVPVNDIPADEVGLDIGPETIKEFCETLSTAKTIAWNGPMGLFEVEEFAKGSNEIAHCLADIDATIVIGGGDTGAVIDKLGLEGKVTHVSTGGGASLKLLEGSKLVAVEALNRNK